MPPRTRLVAVLLLGAGLIVPAAGQAQTASKADQIVRSLAPTGKLDMAIRGVRIGNVPVARILAARTATQTAAVSLNVHFASGSDTLTPQATQALDELGRALNAPTLATYHFRIEGHTDTVGSPDENRVLSERRAAAVAAYLTGKYQIDPARLQAVGMGADGLLIATPDQTPELRNRRVLVVNMGS